MLVGVEVPPTLSEADVEMGSMVANEDLVVALEFVAGMCSMEVIEASHTPPKTEIVMSSSSGNKFPTSKDLERVSNQVSSASLDEHTIFLSFPSLDEG